MFDDEAPPNLYFHNSSLVRSISSQVELLSTAEKLPEEEFISLKIASLFLITGYITDYEKPMEASLVVADEMLPKYGFDPETVDEVMSIIKNSFHNRQKSASDKILHDAIFDYLGRVDYLKLTDKLLREESEFGVTHSREEWLDLQRKLLIDHEFLTDSAKLLRNIPVEDQISTLMSGIE
jgi:hypothetical protein